MIKGFRMKKLLLGITLLASMSSFANSLIKYDLEKIDSHEYEMAYGYLDIHLKEKGYIFNSNNENANFEITNVTYGCAEITNTGNGAYCSEPFANISIKNNQTGFTTNYKGTSGIFSGYSVNQALFDAVDKIPEI